MNVVLGGVGFDPEGGVTIEYMRVPEDVRESGLTAVHRLEVPGDVEEARELLEELHDVTQRLLTRALELMADEEPPGIEQDRAGYDNPLERDEVLP